MSDIQKLFDVIKDDALVTINTNAGRPSVDLAGACGTSFRIRGLFQDSIVIKSDKFPAPEGFFKGEKGENKRADFILIASQRGRKWIVFIEMTKSSRKTAHEVVQQLRGAECVLTYCRCIAKKFWDCNNFLDESQYESRFVHITTGNLNKTPTKQLRGHIHNTPENMLKLKHNLKFEFNKLVGKHPAAAP